MRPAQGLRNLSISRRMFLQAAGGTAASLSFGSHRWLGSLALATPTGLVKSPPVVRTAFVYPPTKDLDKVGYYSWPGSTFNAEGRQRQYMARLQGFERSLGMRIIADRGHLDTADDATRFINEVKADRPDGLLLVPFKKGHWPHVTRIVEETGIPTVILASLGILLVGHVREMYRQPGAYMINSLDNLNAVEQGLRMVRAASWMKQSRILNIARSGSGETTVPHMGTRVQRVTNAGFIEEFQQTGPTPEVKAVAAAYKNSATKVVQPSDNDILDAARACVALKRVVKEAKVDAVMMDCLPGLQHPHKHVPPCMGFMDLRDEGIPAGCESDLDATLTMMLLQYLFDRPGFQHNPTVETEKNHYFCAHCTSASRMRGVDAAAEPYMLMNHAEAGWGCVPRVLFTPGEKVTIAKYLSARSEDAKPQMLVYSGELVSCPPVPQTGGCRTNAETTINELEHVADLKGHHLTMVYGDYAKQLRTFCQLQGVEAVV